jgi:hypothetical protein
MESQGKGKGDIGRRCVGSLYCYNKKLTTYGSEYALSEGPSTSVQQKVRFLIGAPPSPLLSSSPIIIGMLGDVDMDVDDGNEGNKTKGLEDKRYATSNIYPEL